VEKISSECFTVVENNDGKSNCMFSWIIIGKRKDIKDKKKLPPFLSEKSFEENLKKILYNENNTDRGTIPIWWNGEDIIFDQVKTVPSKNKKNIINEPSLIKFVHPLRPNPPIHNEETIH
ncbi:MAG TPA: hypothetical protein P5250_03285, partial [Bacteroidales bacterium]|nr:hypothetical protein [Bacteroidales bacterium]